MLVNVSLLDEYYPISRGDRASSQLQALQMFVHGQARGWQTDLVQCLIQYSVRLCLFYLRVTRLSAPIVAL